MTVYGIVGERDLVPASRVTTTGLLRLLLGEEATHPQTRAVTRNALQEIVRNLKEPIAAAAAIRLNDACRAFVVNFNRPHATGSLFFLAVHIGGRSPGPSAAFMHNVDVRGEPTRRGKSIVSFHVHQMAAALRSFSVIASMNPRSPEVSKRSRLAREAFDDLVDVLRTTGADKSTPQATPPGARRGTRHDTITHKRGKEPPAGSFKVLGVDDFRLSAIRSSIGELDGLFLSRLATSKMGRGRHGRSTGPSAGFQGISFHKSATFGPWRVWNTVPGPGQELFEHQRRNSLEGSPTPPPPRANGAPGRDNKL